MLRMMIRFLLIAGLEGALHGEIPYQTGTLRGCRDGGFHNRNRVDPEWVSVDPMAIPAVAEGDIRQVFVAHEDFPYSHNSHDLVFKVKLDSAYSGLNSDANHLERLPDGSTE